MLPSCSSAKSCPRRPLLARPAPSWEPKLSIQPSRTLRWRHFQGDSGSCGGQAGRRRGFCRCQLAPSLECLCRSGRPGCFGIESGWAHQSTFSSRHRSDAHPSPTRRILSFQSLHLRRFVQPLADRVYGHFLKSLATLLTAGVFTPAGV